MLDFKCVLSFGWLVLVVAVGCESSNSQKKWSKELLPLSSGGDQHQVLFENEHVRVLEVTNPPGGVAPLHVHVWPSVLIAEEPAKIRIRDSAGEIVRDAIPERVTYSEASKEPYSVENIDDHRIRLYRIEIKD